MRGWACAVAALGMMLLQPSDPSVARARPPKRATSTPERPIARREVSPFGIASSGEAASQYAEYLPKLRQIGVRSLRVFGEWEGLEPTERAFLLAPEDARVAALAAHGIEATGIFQYAAAWALPEGVTDRKTFPLARLDAFGRYAGKLAAHYRGRVRAWEVWNEPNAPAFNAGNHTPADYARLVATAYAAVKRADPRAQVGLTVANFDVRYLRLVLEALAASRAGHAFDFIAVHPYELLAQLDAEGGVLRYLAIVPTLRKMLAEIAPAKRDVPIRFSELGARLAADGSAGHRQHDVAALLVKAYALGIAQGVEQIQWFEAKDAGGSQGFGLLDAELRERTPYHAYGALTDALGAYPRYEGWLALGEDGTGYGFVFTSGRTHALVAWMPRGRSAELALAAPYTVIDVLSRRASKREAGAPLVLTDVPVLVRDPPNALVERARSHRAQPFAWGTRVDGPRASIALGKPGAARGLTQVHPETSEPVRCEDGSTGVRVNVGRGNALYLAVDPSFADYATRDVYVHVKARTLAPLPAGHYAGMNLWYQPASGERSAPPAYPYANTGVWWSVPDDQRWHTHSWHLTDAMFVHTFGYGLYLQFDASAPFAVGEVVVSKVPPDASETAGLIGR